MNELPIFDGNLEPLADKFPLWAEHIRSGRLSLVYLVDECDRNWGKIAYFPSEKFRPDDQIAAMLREGFFAPESQIYKDCILLASKPSMVQLVAYLDNGVHSLKLAQQEF